MHSMNYQKCVSNFSSTWFANKLLSSQNGGKKKLFQLLLVQIVEHANKMKRTIIYLLFFLPFLDFWLVTNSKWALLGKPEYLIGNVSSRIFLWFLVRNKNWSHSVTNYQLIQTGSLVARWQVTKTTTHTHNTRIFLFL